MARVLIRVPTWLRLGEAVKANDRNARTPDTRHLEMPASC